MIVWQITAGTQHNNFADTISVEPLLKKNNHVWSNFQTVYEIHYKWAGTDF